MKKAAMIVLLAFGLGLLPAAGISAVENDDLQAVRKAVKKNPNYTGDEVKWFKVLIQDTRTKKDVVRVTLPVSLIELILNHEHRQMKLNDECDIDVRALFQELKKAGPMALIEILDEDDGHLIKVWFE
jgi:hypothetical protein